MLITIALAGCNQKALLGSNPEDAYSDGNKGDTSYHQPVTIWKVVDGVRLVKFTKEELGFTTNLPTFLEIKTKADSLGLALGSATLAADLRTQYTDQPEAEYLLMMTPADSNSDFQMYHLGHYPTVPPAPPSAPWISNGPENLNNQYNYDGAPAFYKHQLVFVVQ